jgi:peroxiredoxin
VRRFLALSLAFLLLGASLALAEPLAVGTKAPDFTLSDQEGRSVRLGDLLARRPFVVLAFYVKAGTSG